MESKKVVRNILIELRQNYLTGKIRHYLDEISASSSLQEAFERRLNYYYRKFGFKFQDFGSLVFNVRKNYKEIMYHVARAEWISKEELEDLVGRALTPCLRHVLEESSDNLIKEFLEKHNIPEEDRGKSGNNFLSKLRESGIEDRLESILSKAIYERHDDVASFLEISLSHYKGALLGAKENDEKVAEITEVLEKRGVDFTNYEELEQSIHEMIKNNNKSPLISSPSSKRDLILFFSFVELSLTNLIQNLKENEEELTDKKRRLQELQEEEEIKNIEGEIEKIETKKKEIKRALEMLLGNLGYFHGLYTHIERLRKY